MFVLGDGVRLTQVLANLLNNALKFTPTGGRITVELAGDEERVRLVVRDTGHGIARQELPDVFKRFKQVDSSTTRAAGGLGLGLAIVEGIVRAHGGDVSASSPGPGFGATFTVHLRRVSHAEESQSTAAPPGHDRDSLQGCEILCVDDDTDALEVMTLVLQGHGAAVRTARSVAEAMAALTASTPDVVVSDIGLPVRDGYALVHQIRTLPGGAARVPAIAVTAYAGAASEQHAREAGFQSFLCKPVRPEALVRAVASVVGR
jgi:CheY-like chemotaxis protein